MPGEALVVLLGPGLPVHHQGRGAAAAPVGGEGHGQRVLSGAQVGDRCGHPVLPPPAQVEDVVEGPVGHVQAPPPQHVALHGQDSGQPRPTVRTDRHVGGDGVGPLAGVGVDIARGLPVIHVNYLGYDEQAHLRGPSSRLAYWSLHGIDRCIRRIWHATHHSLRRDYDVWVYSDHGQEEVVPYPVERQTTIQKAVEKLFHDLMADKEFETEDHAGPHIGWPEWLTGKFDHNADEAAVPGGKPPTVSKNRLIVAARGPVGHIYLPCLLSREQTELFASQLVADVKIPVVLALGDEGEVHAWTEEGRFRLPEDGDRILGKEHPYLKEVSQELADLCHHADKGTFLILGWRKGSRVQAQEWS